MSLLFFAQKRCCVDKWVEVVLVPYPPIPTRLNFLVVLISCEYLLGIWVSQQHVILLHISDLSVFWNALFVVLVVVLDRLSYDKQYCGQERRLQLLLLQKSKVYFFHPWMGFDLLDSLEAQSCFRLSLNQAINKVNTIFWPSIWWDLVELDLLGYHLLSDFFPIGSSVRSLKYYSVLTFPIIISKVITPRAK